MLAINIILMVLIVAFALTQVCIPLFLNLPCFWIFSKTKRAQIDFAFRMAGSGKPKTNQHEHRK